MGWDQLATLAQLVTGIATLAVAVLLVSQLKVQHRDSEREFAFANETKQQDLVASFYGEESAAEVYSKGCHEFDSLSTAESLRFRLMLTNMFLHQVNAWRLQRDGENLERFRLTFIQLLEFPGQRRYFEGWGRKILGLEPLLLDFVEKMYQEIEGQAV